MISCVIEREQQEDVDVVHLEGSLGAYSFPRLASLLSELCDQNRTRVILDCAGIEFISSAALGALIGFARRAHDRNGRLKLAAVPPKILSIVEELGFHKIFEITVDVESAVDTFQY